MRRRPAPGPCGGCTTLPPWCGRPMGRPRSATPWSAWRARPPAPARGGRYRAGVRDALVGLAGRLAGAGRVDLYEARAGGRVAAWSRSGPAGATGPASLRVPLRRAGETWGELRLWADVPHAWSPRLVRMLETL